MTHTKFIIYNMKHKFLFLLLFIGAGVFNGIYSIEREIFILIENPVYVSRKNEPIVISIDSLMISFDLKSVKVLEGDEEIPSQIDDLDGDSRYDEISFLVDLEKQESKKLRMILSDKEKADKYTKRTHAQLMFRTHEQGVYIKGTSICAPGQSNTYNILHHHGVAIENEILAYRIYFDERQTIDLYGKSKKQLELSETLFYPTLKQMSEGYGNDILMVGNSCGAGTLKGWNGKSSTHISPVKERGQRIISYGPIRTIVETEVSGWGYKGRLLDMKILYTLYAGRRELKMDVSFGSSLKDEIFSTGVVDIGGYSEIYSDHKGFISSWGSNYPDSDTIKFKKETLGIATYIPRRFVVNECKDKDNFLYLLHSPGNRGFYYYTLFYSCKEKETYMDKNKWFHESVTTAWLLDNPCNIRINFH